MKQSRGENFTENCTEDFNEYFVEFIVTQTSNSEYVKNFKKVTIPITLLIGIRGYIVLDKNLT